MGEKGERGRTERRVQTFSSSLRFSLRFFLLRAISARRMACSSAVRCFFVCGSGWAGMSGRTKWGVEDRSRGDGCAT